MLLRSFCAIRSQATTKNDPAWRLGWQDQGWLGLGVRPGDRGPLRECWAPRQRVQFGDHLEELRPSAAGLKDT